MIETWAPPLPFLKAFRIYTLSNLARYIPGKIWQLLGVAYLADKENVSGMKASYTTAISFIVSIISGGIFSIIFLYQNPLVRKYVDVKSIIFLLVLLLILIHPYFIVKLTNIMRKIVKRDFEIVTLRLFELIKFFFLFSVFWIIYGIAFIFFVKSFYSIDLISDISIAAIYPLSFIAGYLVLVAPGGLGVREGMVTYLLTFYMPLSVAGIIAVSSRIWFTSAELVSVAVALRVR